MRNYFKTLGLDASASKDHLQEILEVNNGISTDLNPRHRVDALEVLLDEERLPAYASATLLYENLNKVASVLDEPVAKNTHRWRERLSEFDSLDAETNS